MLEVVMRSLASFLVLALLAAPVDARPTKKPAPPPQEEAEEETEEAPAAEASPEAPGGLDTSDAEAVAKMLALSSGEAPAPTGPPPALQKKLVPVLAAINARLQLEEPLKMLELQYFGAADVDGDSVAELIVSWARGKTLGGVALVRRTATEHKVLAVADVKEPVLRVQAIGLAGDKGRHLLIRSGANDPARGTIRTSAVWGVADRGLRKIWEQRDVDAIENNPDLSKDREASLSDITFQDGVDGKPGTLTVAVTEYRAPKGKGAEATETRGSRTMVYTFDRAKRVMVLKSKREDGPPPDETAQ